jgi:hypothetical protein
MDNSLENDKRSITSENSLSENVGLPLNQSSYAVARKRQLAWMEKGFDLNTNGQSTWSRSELHLFDDDPDFTEQA